MSFPLSDVGPALRAGGAEEAPNTLIGWLRAFFSHHLQSLAIGTRPEQKF
jgi:hypothetical protein